MPLNGERAEPIATKAEQTPAFPEPAPGIATERASLKTPTRLPWRRPIATGRWPEPSSGQAARLPHRRRWETLRRRLPTKARSPCRRTGSKRGGEVGLPAASAWQKTSVRRSEGRCTQDASPEEIFKPPMVAGRAAGVKGSGQKSGRLTPWRVCWCVRQQYKKIYLPAPSSMKKSASEGPRRRVRSPTPLSPSAGLRPRRLTQTGRCHAILQGVPP